MLATLAALVTLQFMPRDVQLSTTLQRAARKKGWNYAMHGHPVLGAHRFSVNEMLMDGHHDVRFRIDERKSTVEATFIVKKLKKTHEVRTAMEEPLLKGTGLKVDVADYSAKRLSSLKGYAASNLRIYGIVKNSAIFIEARPAGAGGVQFPAASTKDQERAYADIIGFAKLLADELKKK